MKSQKGFSIIIIFITVVLLLSVAAAILYSSRTPQQISQITSSPHSSPRSTTSPTISPNSDFPPLYLKVEWKEKTQQKIIFIGEKGEMIELIGYRIVTEPFVLSTADEYNQYYSNYLSGQGWIEVENASGSEGEIISYIKDNKHLTVGFRRVVGENKFYGFLEYD
jgi:hypothetical protein